MANFFTNIYNIPIYSITKEEFDNLSLEDVNYSGILFIFAVKYDETICNKIKEWQLNKEYRLDNVLAAGMFYVENCDIQPIYGKKQLFNELYYMDSIKKIYVLRGMDNNNNELRKIICEIANINDIGDLSDGYHTFNQLYHQRAVLFATIVNQNKDISWKSFKHSDGKYCFDSDGEWFIVGIDTPEGSYTYHYEKSYWDMFKCQELECGKEWDGHTEEDVTRLLSLEK